MLPASKQHQNFMLSNLLSNYHSYYKYFSVKLFSHCLIYRATDYSNIASGHVDQPGLCWSESISLIIWLSLHIRYVKLWKLYQ